MICASGTTGVRTESFTTVQPPRFACAGPVFHLAPTLVWDGAQSRDSDALSPPQYPCRRRRTAWCRIPHPRAPGRGTSDPNRNRRTSGLRNSQGEHRRIDLLIADNTMPGLTGSELISKLQEVGFRGKCMMLPPTCRRTWRGLYRSQAVQSGGAETCCC